jgi:nitroreductase
MLEGTIMDALTLLLTRHSQPRLTAPAPADEALENIKQAALRAPDHACLKPWKFIVCTGKGLDKLGDILQDSAISSDKEQVSIDRALQLPHRAPMVIIAINQYKQHDKVPKEEQIAATACAVQSMQMAALVQGFAGIWRTGSYAQCPYVKQSLELNEDDEIVGFLYLGTSNMKALPKPVIDSDAYFTHWT